MIEIVKESHVDHGLTGEQLAYVLEQCPKSAGLIKQTLELPEELGTVPCALYGPAMGDEPVPEMHVYYNERPGRDGESRLVMQPTRPTRIVSLIAGPHGDKTCVLYTAFGGPIAPRELYEQDDEEGRKFWSEHALADDAPPIG